MRTYFDFIKLEPVTPVATGNKQQNKADINPLSMAAHVTDRLTINGNTGNTSSSLPPVTTQNDVPVTLTHRENNAATTVTDVTDQNSELCYLYNERAAIYQYEAGYAQEEAERLASLEIFTDTKKIEEEKSAKCITHAT
jgi:hypothetical protein